MKMTEALEIEMKVIWVKPNKRHRPWKFWEPKEIRTVDGSDGLDLSVENEVLKREISMLKFQISQIPQIETELKKADPQNDRILGMNALQIEQLKNFWMRHNEELPK